MTPKHKGDLCYEGRKVDPTAWKVGKATDLSHLVGCCCECGKVVRGREAVPSPDPFAEEIHENMTPVVECDVCRDESRQEI